MLLLSPAAPLRDPKTGMLATLQAALIVSPRAGRIAPRPGRLWLLLKLSLRNYSATPRPFRSNDFFALGSGGDTYPATVRDPGHHMLRSGTLSPRTTIGAWIGYDLPRGPARGSIYWSDDSALVPPGKFTDYSILRALSRTSSVL